MSTFVLDASLALQWFFEDESERQYSLDVLASLATNRALVPSLWFYEVSNGLLMALRRKRVSLAQLEGFLVRLKALPIELTEQSPTDILDLHTLAHAHNLTSYDAAYLALASRAGLPLATTDAALRAAAASGGVELWIS